MIKTKPTTPATPAKPSSHLERLIELLRRPEGVTCEEAAAVLPWQPHTVRARIGSDLRKAGHTINKTVDEARGGRVYRILA